ncbi:hypothetical protein LTR66_001238 [Elasticomyces elasticus]|nr:hypothetical protein LTR66_001238 [Elasticomyces elasticus]
MSSRLSYYLQRSVRFLSPAPPVIANRYPRLHYVLRVTEAAGYFLLFGHLFLTYGFSYTGTWGLSMLPSIASSGDFVLISKFYRHGRGLEIGDLVTYKHPYHGDQGVYGIKRLVGLPGDFVLRDSPGAKEGVMIQVPQGHCWIVGDNLPLSRDSRMFGPIPLGLITGKVIAKSQLFGRDFEWMKNPLQDVADDMHDEEDETL